MNSDGTAKPRVIVHADMDAFYASVEQLDNPQLRGKPVIVGPPSGRGVVLTASYEARPSNVGSAMPMAVAIRRCPDAIVVPPRFEHYQAISRKIMAAFREFSGDVEPLSLDEAFIDMSGAEAFFGSPQNIGEQIRAAVRDVTGGLTASVGISATKYVAKVASGFKKPDGLTIVPGNEARAWLAPLPVSRLWGAGAKTQARLTQAGFATIGQIAAADPERLEALFGRMGRRFHALANARDDRDVVSQRAAKSIGWERTFEEDLSDASEIEYFVRKAAGEVAARLRRENYRAGGVRLKLKSADFTIHSRQRALPQPTQAGAELSAHALAMLPELLSHRPLRLIGVSTFALERAAEASPQQQGLFDDAPKRKDAALERTLDALEARFGNQAVRRGGDWVHKRDLGVAFRAGDEDDPER